jgi:cobalt/nickel transport system permease protein
MHIPDGYLSPASCVLTYALMLPCWWLAFARIKRLLHTRMVPLLAVFSAFSFVIMMFNLPLPGGTSGHAIGVTVASIVLGPWAATVAVSIALLIQAVFFGDGGITTLGANCLNMALLGSFAAYGCYTLIAGQSALTSRRRVVAAAIAGYLAINLSALLAAVEFGLQPLLFHDAMGAPLYAPYPLSIAIPAMMIGHLTFAGLAELFISAGLIRYLQVNHLELLQGSIGTHAPQARSWFAARRLWLGLLALALATPLGLLAAGSAWGEWGVSDFSNPVARHEILQASGHVAPPASAPQGLAWLSDLWNAPFSDYAPAFIRHAGVGYVFSALCGSALILLVFMLFARVASRRRIARLLH